MSSETYATRSLENFGTLQLLLESYLKACQDQAALEARISAIQAMLVDSWSGRATESQRESLGNGTGSRSNDTVKALLELIKHKSTQATTGQVDISRALEQATATGTPDFMQALRQLRNVPTGRESQPRATIGPCATTGQQTQLPLELQLVALLRKMANRKSAPGLVQAAEQNQANDSGTGSNSACLSNALRSLSNGAICQLLLEVVGHQPSGSTWISPTSSAAASVVPECSRDTMPSPALSPKGKYPKFPQLLHDMLIGLEEQGQGHIASFTPDGMGFVIHKPKEFMKDALSKHSHASSYASFQRQVNLYCFTRTKCGTASLYSHPLFQRDQPQLCLGMVRTKIKSGGPSFVQYVKSKKSAEERAKTMQGQWNEEKQAANTRLW